MMKNFKIALYIIFSLTVFFSCSKTTEEQKAPEQKEEQHEETPSNIATLDQEQIKSIGLQLGTIEMKELTSSIKANGLLRVPNNSKASVAAMFGGIIQTLRIQEGDYVRKGQVIATVSNPDYILKQEEYLTVLSRITYAEQESRRQQELYDNDAGAKKNLQVASAELKTLRAQKASLVRQLQMMGINPGSVSNKNLRNGMAITSPISGIVSRITTEIGSYVDISTPVAEIIDNSSIHLDLHVFEKDLPKMKVGQIINFRLTNNPEISYQAQVYSIGSSFENSSKTISVHSKVIGNKVGLIDGMNVIGQVSLSNVLTKAVPNDAIVEADGKFYIFVQTNKKAEDHSKEPAHDDHGHAHDEGETEHQHENEKQAADHAKKQAQDLNFEKIEVVKGTTDMGYTAITLVKDIPEGAKIVIKGAFFINAKLSNTEDHSH